MKGLLLKDWYMMKKYCRMYILITVIFLGVSIVNTENLFIVFYPCVLCGMIPVTLLGYDERSHWLLYSCTLPYSRKQVVSAKYLIGLCTQVAVLLLTAATQAVAMSVNGTFVIGDFLILIFAMLFVSAFASSISLPFIFRYGVEKGRLAYYVMIGFVCAASFLASNLLGDRSFATSNSVLIYLLLGVFGLGIYALSWYFSVTFYQKREL